MIGRKTESESEMPPEYLGFRLRIVSAIWFSLAAVIPVGFFLYLFLVHFNVGSYLFNSGFWAFTGLPIASAALAGYTIGSRILDPWEIESASRARWQGLKTAATAYAIQMLTYTAIGVFATLGQPLVNVLYGAIGIFFVIGFYGAIFVGWLVVIVGLLSGWMLFKVSRLERFESFLFETEKITDRAARLQVLTITLIFLAASIPSAATFRSELQSYYLKDAKERQYLAIMQAADRGDAPALESLLKDGADPNIRIDDDDTPPIIFAVGSRQSEAVLILLQHGADPNVSEIKNENFTPLGNAAVMGDLETVKALLDYGANVHKSDGQGYTPLMRSVLAGHVEVTELLLDNGADMNESTAVLGYKNVLSLFFEQEERNKKLNAQRDPTVSPLKLHPEMIEFFKNAVPSDSESCENRNR